MKVNKTAMMSIRFSKEEMDALRAHAEQKDISVGQLIRHAIRDMFKGDENGIH